MKYKIIIMLLSFLASCDPVHSLKLDNQTGKKIEVLYSPRSATSQFGDSKAEMIEFNGRYLNKIILDSSESLNIGIVNARYTPVANDIDIDYLEVRYGTDTIRLIGKNAILSTIQKVKKLDWRLIIK